MSTPDSPAIPPALYRVEYWAAGVPGAPVNVYNFNGRPVPREFADRFLTKVLARAERVEGRRFAGHVLETDHAC